MKKLTDEECRALGLRTDEQIQASRKAWADARARRLGKKKKRRRRA